MSLEDAIKAYGLPLSRRSLFANGTCIVRRPRPTLSSTVARSASITRSPSALTPPPPASTSSVDLRCLLSTSFSLIPSLASPTSTHDLARRYMGRASSPVRRGGGGGGRGDRRDHYEPRRRSPDRYGASRLLSPVGTHALQIGTVARLTVAAPPVARAPPRRAAPLIAAAVPTAAAALSAAARPSVAMTATIGGTTDAMVTAIDATTGSYSLASVDRSRVSTPRNTSAQKVSKVCDLMR